MNKKSLGVGVVGSGRIGTLRANLVSHHPSLEFLAVSDIDQDRAKELGDQVGAQLATGKNEEVIEHPDVTTVIVSTPEHDHADSIIHALELGKPVLVEKPISLTLEDADRILSVAERTGTELRVGYAQRFKRRYQMAKEQIIQGRLGEILAGTGRTCNTRAQGLQILKRSPHATPVLDVLTYWVDMTCWFMEGHRPVEVVARGNGKIYKELGYSANDVTWSIVTFDNGAVMNLGVFYALPAKYPALGQSVRLEIYGTDGVLMLDEDHKDEMLYTDKGIPHTYIPDHYINTAFLSSTTPGDWAAGDYWGPLGDETRSWLDHVINGRPTTHATAEDARQTLEVTIAIELSSKTGEAVHLPLGEGH